MNTYFNYLCSTLLIIFLSACQSSEHNQKVYQQQLFTFGTLVDITILSDNSEQASQAINAISSEFDRLHSLWHPWNNGALGEINKNLARSEQAAITGEQSILRLIEDSKILSEKSNGLFNPAIGQLVRLWQFDKIEKENYQFKIPTSETIQNLVTQNPQMQDILIHDQKIRSSNPSVSFDFGAFAKGVAIENMMQILKTHHIANALINAGGDLKVLGTKNGKAWRIGIKNPVITHDSSRKAIIAAINLNDSETLFTSGNYERFFEIKGKRYHHIIDPRSGYPATGTQSVTILTQDAALADAASTALFIAGPDQWPEIAKKMGIQHVMLISDDNTIYMTPAMAKRIDLLTEAKAEIIPIILKQPGKSL